MGEADKPKAFDRNSFGTSVEFGPICVPVLPSLGLASRLENYANWTASPQGMDIHFGNYQVGGPGLTTITIPWSALSDVLAPGMQAVLSS